MVRSKEPSVCYVSPTELVRRPISELIAVQTQQGNREVGLLVARSGRKVDNTMHHSADARKATIHSYRVFSPPLSSEWPIPGFGFWRQARNVLRTYDVVHIWGHFYLSTLFLLMLSWFYPRTKVVLSIDTFPGYSFRLTTLGNIAFFLFTWTAGRIIYLTPDRILLYGEALREHARRSGIPNRKLQVLGTGIRPAKVKPRARATTRRSLGIPANAKVVLFCGIVNWRKRVDTVLAVAEKTREENIVYLIAGDGPHKERFEQMARERNLQNVRFLGWRKDIFDLLAASDLYFFPSSAEGLSGTIMEAMLTGTPVLTTAIPCTTDLIQDGVTGSLCQVGAVPCFTKKLRMLLAKPALAESYAQRAQRKILSEYSWTVVQPRYAALYHELTQQQVSARRAR